MDLPASGYTARRSLVLSLTASMARPKCHGPGLPENGAIAQLGERFNGIEEVVGSIPSGSTSNFNKLA